MYDNGESVEEMSWNLCGNESGGIATIKFHLTKDLNNEIVAIQPPGLVLNHEKTAVLT